MCAVYFTYLVNGDMNVQSINFNRLFFLIISETNILCAYNLDFYV